MSKVRVAINGFGRIGRQVFRILHAGFAKDVEIVAINDLGSAESNFHLFEYDSTYGRAHVDVTLDGQVAHVKGAEKDGVKFDDWTIQCISERDPKNLPWSKYNVDIVIESTGVFTNADQAKVHLENGAKKIIFSAPAKGEDLTLVIGVNHEDYDPAKHHMVSNASCTTNCLAPAAKVLNDAFGIKLGTMCTIHSYTNDQRILDMPHKDLRRARAAALNIIPTSTGAAQAVAKVIPSLKGKFSGYSLRVPTPTVSVVDFTCVLDKSTDTETMVKVLKEAAEGPLKGILAINEKPLVSMDFKGDSHSSIVEVDYCTVQEGNLAKLMLWYDNEWGYSSRVCDLIMIMREKGL